MGYGSGDTSWGNKSDDAYGKFFVRAVRAVGPDSSLEREALIALYRSANGDHWTDNSGWKEAPLHADGFAMPGTECNWFGVTCDGSNTKIIGLNLNKNNLNGFISGVSGLTDLEVFDLGNNRLSPSIPKELARFKNLGMRCQPGAGELRGNTATATSQAIA
jgi:hypothetical protein